MTPIALPENYRTDLTLRYLGRDPDSLCERVSGNVVERANLRIELHPREVIVDGDASTARRLLGLTVDVRPFELAHPELASGHEGAHLPQTATVFESLLWAIVGQQVNLPFAYRLRRVVIELGGTRAANGLYVHPGAEDVARLEPADLTSRQFSRSKAQYVLDAARLVASGELPVESFPALEPEEVERRLVAVRGVGPWTANYVMLRGCGFPDCVPAGDSALSASLRQFFALDHKVDGNETRTLMERYAPWRSLATLHFWLRKTT